MTQYDDMHDAELEEIVAYLDGELSGEAGARIERRLASDEDFRQQLQSVERAWTALDDLPMATVDDRFSRTTMSMVIEAAAEELQARTRAVPIARRRRWMSTALAASVALALGFLAFRLAWNNPNQLLLADLPVIDNIDIYSQFQNLEFLERLQDELGDELARLSGDGHDLDAREQHFADVADPVAAEKWLRSLNDDQRTTLRAKFNRFRDLPEKEQRRIRELHQRIVGSDDARRLERTMLAYQQWLGGLSPIKQFELRTNEDIEARVAQIALWAGDMRDDELLTLTDAELKSFFDEMRQPINKLREDVTKENRDGDRDRLKMLLGQNFADWRRELFEHFADRGRGRRNLFYMAVLRALPDRSRGRFAELPPREQVERFLTWMRQYTTCKGAVTQEDLEEFFAEELDAKMQAQLLSLPPGDMEQALRQMYRCQPKSGTQVRWSWTPSGQPVAEPIDGADKDGDGRAESGGRSEGDDHGPGGGGRRGDGPPPGGRRGMPGPPPREFGPRPEFGPPLGPAGFRRGDVQPPFRGGLEPRGGDPPRYD